MSEDRTRVRIAGLSTNTIVIVVTLVCCTFVATYYPTRALRRTSDQIAIEHSALYKLLGQYQATADAANGPVLKRFDVLQQRMDLLNQLLIDNQETALELKTAINAREKKEGHAPGVHEFGASPFELPANPASAPAIHKPEKP